MERDQTKFVQRYNAKVKHKENLNEITTPDGIFLKTKSRRVDNEEIEESETEEKDKKKTLRPNFKIDTVSYEGGSKEKSLKSTARTPKSKKVSLSTGLKSQIQSRNVSGLNSMAQSA